MHRGKYILNTNETINGTKYSKNEFKKMILSILSKKTDKFPLDIPRPIRVESGETNFNKNNILDFDKNNKVMTLGYHMGGAFRTWKQTWPPNTEHIYFYYNHTNAPEGISQEIIEERIQTAFDTWNSIYHCRLQLHYLGTRYEGQINNETSVILWNPSLAYPAQEISNPYGLSNRNFGYQTKKTGSDIVLRTYLRPSIKD